MSDEASGQDRWAAQRPVTDGHEQLTLVVEADGALVPTSSAIPPYEEPTLVGVTSATRAVIGTRAALGVWALVFAGISIVQRLRADSAIVSQFPIRLLGWLGCLLAAAAAAVGWWWSDRYAINIHRLGGRLPGRVRCVTAWVAPFFWVGLLALTLVQLDPTEVFDVRPTIIAVVFVAAMWRPYALCRRLVRSLSRVDADAWVGTAYVIDVAAFGVLWWQFYRWPDALEPSSADSVDGVVGLVMAAAIAHCVMFIVWIGIARVARSALQHRRVAMRTHHDHRHLRLRGIDPMDPAVRWALLKIRQDELEIGNGSGLPRDRPDPARADSVTGDARADVGNHDVEPPGVPAADVVIIDAHAVVQAPNRDTPVPVGDVAEPAGEVRDPDEVERAHDGQTPAALHRSGADESTTPPRDESDAPMPTLPDPPVHQGQGPVVHGPSDSVEARDDARRPDAPAADRGQSQSTGDSQPEAPRPAGDRIRRLTERLQFDETVVEHRELDRIAERMSGALTQESNDLVERLAQYGIIPSATSVTTEERSYVRSGSSELMHRNPMLEIVRYLMLVALAAMTGVTVWLIVRTLSIDLESGRIPAGEIDAIDLIRRTEFVVAQVALVSICAWALMVVSVARGYGIAPARSMRIVVALFSTVVVASGASLAFDLDRTAVSLAVLAFDAIAVGAAIGETRRVDERLGGGSMALSVWAYLLLLVPISMWAAELYHPIDVDAEVGSILFFSALRVMVLAASVTLAGVATGRIDERIRFALAAADSEAS